MASRRPPISASARPRVLGHTALGTYALRHPAHRCGAQMHGTQTQGAQVRRSDTRHTDAGRPDTRRPDTLRAHVRRSKLRRTGTALRHTAVRHRLPIHPARAGTALEVTARRHTALRHRPPRHPALTNAALRHPGTQTRGAHGCRVRKYRTGGRSGVPAQACANPHLSTMFHVKHPHCWTRHRPTAFPSWPDRPATDSLATSHATIRSTPSTTS
jgi:hypothetical protein